MPNINAPIQFFADRDGNPLESGFVYIGVVGQNPETTPIPVYWDSALTQPAAQPLRTASGMIYRNGSPAQVYVTTAYSITVRDKNGGLVYTFLDSGEFDAALILRADLANNSDAAKGDALIGMRQPLANAVGRTVHDKLTEVVSVKDFGAVGDGVTNDDAAFAAAAALGVPYLVPATAAHYVLTVAPAGAPYGPGIVWVAGVPYQIPNPGAATFGARQAITASAPGQALISNADGVTVRWGRPVRENILPNTNWQLWGTGYVTRQNQAGTADSVAVSCTSFTTANNAPTFYTTDTKDLKAGDIVVVSAAGGWKWGFAGAGYVSTLMPVRVAQVIANAEVHLESVPFGGVSPAASSAATLTPITGGVSSAGSGQSADGWKKSGTLMSWADDWPANQYGGAIRTHGLRKTAAGAGDGDFIYYLPAAQVPKYRNRTITFGVKVYQKVKSGAGTWYPFINDGVTVTNGANGSGVAGFEYRTVTATIGPNVTSLAIGIKLTGAIGDVYFVALPTAGIGDSLAEADLGANIVELVRPVGHWNPPILTPFAIDFPAVAYPGAPGLYGWSGIDLEAISCCAVHKSVAAVKAKIEWQTNTVGAYIFTGSKLDYSLIFGPQACTNVAAINDVGQGWLPLADDGTFTLFTGTAALHPTTATFDFDCVQLSQPMAAN